MLGAIAAVALVVGSIGATVSVSQDDQQKVDRAGEPVVEVQASERAESTSE